MRQFFYISLFILRIFCSAVMLLHHLYFLATDEHRFTQIKFDLSILKLFQLLSQLIKLIMLLVFFVKTSPTNGEFFHLQTP
jgi:hypothetical protein